MESQQHGTNPAGAVRVVEAQAAIPGVMALFRDKQILAHLTLAA